MYYQQGDVLIKRIEKLPDDVKGVKQEGSRVILAEGEHTGHAHAISSPNAHLFEWNEKLYLEATTEVEIKHEEHKTVIIPPGIYEIDRVREYDHFEEVARVVWD